MEYTQPYTKDTDCDISEPLIELGISNCFKDGLFAKDVFIIDSGADITCIKSEIFDVLDLDIYEERTVMGMGDSKGRKYHSSQVLIEIPELDIRKKTEVIIMEDRDNLLGRDILDYIKVILNGPEQSYSLIVGNNEEG